MTSSEQLHGLYVITDPELCKDNLLQQAEQALRGGAKILQYRNKRASEQQKREEATALQLLCKTYHCIFIINDDVDLAKTVNADGVHIGQSDAALLHARQVLGPDKIIGVSCNNQLEWALTAQQHGADYIAFGRFFASSTKPEAPPAAITLLKEGHARLHIPIVAIGGVTQENASELIEAGADMIAVIHGVFGQPDPQQAAAHLQALFD